MKNKYLLFTVALTIMAINLLNGELSAFERLSPADLWPVIAITLVSFLVKTGVLSAVLIGAKKLWEKLLRRNR